MTTSLSPARSLIASRWPACAAAQGIPSAGSAGLDSQGTFFVLHNHIPRPELHPAHDAAAETLMRVCEDAGWIVQRGTRGEGDDRPTWRVVGLASAECPDCGGLGGMDASGFSYRCSRCNVTGRIPLSSLEPWHPARVKRDEVLAADRAHRDGPPPPCREAERGAARLATWRRAYAGK